VSGALIFSERNRLPEAVASRLAIVVEELVTYLYVHGGLAAPDVLELELSVDRLGIRLIMIDQGMPFDVRRISEPRVLPERGGGAGLAIVRAWATHIDYRSQAGRNELTLTLPLATE
jgi:anti-sigma regulatory factor (Ser/Thr protein kinase)